MMKYGGSLQDMHCHLDLYPDFEKQIQNREKYGVRTLSVTTTPRAWQRNKNLTRNCKYIRSALGLHPELVASEHGAVDLWDRFFSETDFIGEVGLDGRPGNRKHLDKQSEVFEHVLQSCSRAGKKIVSVHSAGAVGTVLDLVGRNMSNSTVKIILHWFAGTVRQAERAVEMGCLFSINARMFNTKKWEALRSLIPLDRVFVETDSPFVEQRYVGRELDLIELTMERIATEMNVGRNDIGGILNSNFSLLFSPS